MGRNFRRMLWPLLVAGALTFQTQHLTRRAGISWLSGLPIQVGPQQIPALVAPWVFIVFMAFFYNRWLFSSYSWLLAIRLRRNRRLWLLAIWRTVRSTGAATVIWCAWQIGWSGKLPAPMYQLLLFLATAFALGVWQLVVSLWFDPRIGLFVMLGWSFLSLSGGTWLSSLARGSWWQVLCWPQLLSVGRATAYPVASLGLVAVVALLLPLWLSQHALARADWTLIK